MSIPTQTLDLTDLPSPEGSPEPGACVRIERVEDGKLLRLRLDPPHRPSGPVFDGPLLRDLDLALAEAERDATAQGLVLCGRDPLTFCYGADVDVIASITDAEHAERLGRTGQRVFQRLFRLGKRGGGRLVTVAAVGGPVPGGAFEVSLACDHIVLADDDKSRIGLPEVKLGILPGWGGTQRLPRRVGLPAAVGAIVSGKLYTARQAHKLGLVDRTTHPAFLERVADGIALGRERLPARERGWRERLIDRNPLARAVIARQARRGIRRETGGHYPAPFEALERTLEAGRLSLEVGLAREAESLGRLAATRESRALVAIHRNTEAAKRAARRPAGGREPRFERACVVGAGVMGGGIASLLALRGFSTRLADLSQAQLDEAQVLHERAVKKARQRRRLAPHEADGALDRLELTRTELGFGACDLLIECVAEVLEVKRKVLGAYAERVREDAVLCTNTSSLSVDAIAAGLPRPERVIGLHFFNPVDRMPLVEVVRGRSSDQAVVRRAVQLAIDLGKTPVVCADAPGFVVNRLLVPYLDEALRLFETGSSPAELDRLATEFGLPMGPFTVIDSVGLDIGQHTANSLERAFGARMTPSGVLAPLIEAGELGRKSGRGIFVHGERRRRDDDDPLPENPRLSRPKGAPVVSTLPDDERLDRLLLPMVNEAARLLDEGVVTSADQLDLASVYGMGFPPFRGGLLAWADARGLQAVVDRLGQLARSKEVVSRPGGPERFEPCAALVARADAGEPYRPELAR